MDAQTTNDYSVYPNVYNQWVEEYIESWKRDKSVFYNSGVLLKYRQEGDYLVFDQDYANVTILYHGIIVDEDGLPYLTDKEVQALAAYCAYIDIYKKSLIQKDGNLFQLAAAVKNDWLRLCNSARIPAHLSQNDINNVLDVKTRWDRKMYGKNSLLYYKANKSMNYGMFKHAFSVEEIYTGLNKKLLKGRWVKIDIKSKATCCKDF